jgi:uncharacterized repeat protein (TIGR03843 family)
MSTPPVRTPPSSPLTLLRDGHVELRGRLQWASNATFLVDICLGEQEAIGVYKPRRGERPLWDFPPGLDRREVAAWELSEALGWGLVPPTVVRDGPLGPGSVQWFVEADFEEHYFTLLEDPRHHHALKAVCAFDVIANNTDRKSGHCLLGLDGRIYGIDHGLCFHEQTKLRTVIWDFGGEPVPEDLLPGIERVAEKLPLPLVGLLDTDEQAAVQQRARALLRAGVFPVDHTGRPYPWPLV